MEYGDFKYCYINKAGSAVKLKNGKYVAIIGLTKQCKEQSVLVIPDYIDDKPVVQIGMTGIGFSHSISYGIYTKLYLPISIAIIHDSGYSVNTPNTKVFMRDLLDFDFLSQKGGFYVPQVLYNKFTNENGIAAAEDILQIANVTYMSNDEVYFIDDYNDSDLINIPVTPMREGYEFMGWYKDAEFINEWDFENDVFNTSLAAPTMVLYAKWRGI
jgi:uncharacterized repeat protein (TIGR02543 family)